MELKELLEALKASFETFKVENDKRLKEIEKTGSASQETENKVNALNGQIDELQSRIQELQASQKETETLLARPGNAPGGDVEAMKHAREFFALANGGRSDGNVDMEAYNAYRQAFNSYLRRGENGEVRNAMSVGSDPNGGYLVTPDTTGRIVQLVYETSAVRQLATVVTIGTDALEGPRDLDEAGAGWVGETQSRTETDTPEVGEWRIPVHEQYAEPRITQKLLDDAGFNVEQWLERKVADKLARAENDAFVNGDGVLKPRGFLTYTAGTPSASTFERIRQINSGASGAFAASNPGDKLIDLVFALKSKYRMNANFAMNRATLAETRKLKDGDGNYLWQPDFSERQGGNLLGYPIAEFEDMPDLAANSLSIAFGDFREASTIVERAGIRVLRDPFTAKPYIKFYTTKRVGGGVTNFEALLLMKFAA